MYKPTAARLIHAMRKDYDQYYASLAASQAPSAHDTPALTNFSEFGEEDEDIKPSIEHLNSLSDYRKRSRSAEDVGSPGPVKTPKINGMSTPNGFATQEIDAAPYTIAGEGVKAELMEDPMVMGMSLS